MRKKIPIWTGAALRSRKEMRYDTGFLYHSDSVLQRLPLSAPVSVFLNREGEVPRGVIIAHIAYDFFQGGVVIGKLAFFNPLAE